MQFKDLIRLPYQKLIVVKYVYIIRTSSLKLQLGSYILNLLYRPYVQDGK